MAWQGRSVCDPALHAQVQTQAQAQAQAQAQHPAQASVACKQQRCWLRLGKQRNGISGQAAPQSTTCSLCFEWLAATLRRVHTYCCTACLPAAAALALAAVVHLRPTD
jgi:hypothetical protein